MWGLLCGSRHRSPSMSERWRLANRSPRRLCSAAASRSCWAFSWSDISSPMAHTPRTLAPICLCGWPHVVLLFCLKKEIHSPAGLDGPSLRFYSHSRIVGPTGKIIHDLDNMRIASSSLSYRRRAHMPRHCYLLAIDRHTTCLFKLIITLLPETQPLSESNLIEKRSISMSRRWC